MFQYLSDRYGVKQGDAEHVFENAFDPIMKDVMVLLKSWSRKKPTLNNVVESLQRSSKKHRKRVYDGDHMKMATVKAKGYTRKEILIAVALMEWKELITVEFVSLNQVYAKRRRGRDFLLKIKNG